MSNVHLSGKKDSLARGWKVMYLDYAVERTLTNIVVLGKKNWSRLRLNQKIRKFVLFSLLSLYWEELDLIIKCQLYFTPLICSLDSRSSECQITKRHNWLKSENRVSLVK